MQMLDLKLAGEFLLMAATLMQIKSKMLLPAEERVLEEEEPEDPRAELAQRLMEYKRFKEAAVRLDGLQEQQAKVFRRKGVSDVCEAGSEEGQDYFEASLFDLISAFSKVLKAVPRKDFLKIIKDEFTVEQKIHDLLHLLVANPVIYFSKLFARAKHRVEVIATFLALLELIRLKEIIVCQSRSFDEIQIKRCPEHVMGSQ
jgi:segregation and condensation protein A